MAVSAPRRARIQAAVDAHQEPVQSGNSLMLVGRPGIVLRGPNNNVTAEGILYEQLLRDRGGPTRRGEHLGHFHPDARIVHLNGREEVEDRRGIMRHTRNWDPAANAGRGAFAYTRAGMRLTPKVSYIVNVPVIGHARNPDGTWRTFTTQRDGRAVTVPVTDDMIGRFATPGGLNVARDVGDHHRQKSFIRDAIRSWLMHQSRDGDNHILLNDFVASDMYYTFDEHRLGDYNGFEFSEEFQNFREHAPPTTEAILGIPLRAPGVIPIPREMLWQHNLVPECRRDYNGQCVKHQLLVA